MAFAPSPGRTRIGAAFAAAAVQFGFAALVIWGLAAHWASPRDRTPTLVTITPSRPPTPSPSPAARDAGASAPSARKSEPLPVVAPSPPVTLTVPRPAATAAGTGDDASVGAALAGRGSGAGGSGAGSGSGEGGLGTGGGAVTSPVRIAGALRDRDYPRGANAGGTVAISFRVRSDGLVDRCTVIVASGAAVLDRLTCDLVERRFRYRPARSAAGEAVDTVLQTSFTWGTRQRD